MFYHIEQLYFAVILTLSPGIVSSSSKRSFKNFSVVKHDSKYYEIEVFEGGEFGFEDLKELIEAQKEMGAEQLPVIVLCGDYSSTDVDFMNHLSKNANDPYSLADAFVITSLAQKILTNFYIMIVRPERPTKFFNTKEDAFSWIQKYIK